MKKSMFDKKQKGFTLLELLVVITLLAILSVGALVAYEGIGDNAQATAAANNTSGADRAIRNFRAVTQNYPNQWDNLSASASAAPYSTDQVAIETQQAFGSFNLGASTAAFQTAFQNAFADVGIDRVQQMTANNTQTGVEPNLQHNEGANPNATETALTAVTNISIMPSVEVGGVAGVAGTACTAGGQDVSSAFAVGGTYNNATVIALDNSYGLKLNKINDSLEDDECHLVVALGFGHDAAHSTSGSSVAISTAPTYVSKDINPNNAYARYVALFHVGTDGDADQNIDETEVFNTPRLLAVVDTEGHMIDENIAAQNPAN
jgi:prepilin-type N-terminal cleavage/methylation domain-containing protein